MTKSSHLLRNPARLALLCLFGLGLVLTAQAQALKPSTSGKNGLKLDQTTPAQRLTPRQQQADFIVAIVNSEVVTNNEVQQRVVALQRQLSQQGGEMPPRAALVHEVMERLINEKAQLQTAQETGLKVEDTAVDLAEENIARRNQMDLATFRERLRSEGLDDKVFREELRKQVTLQRLRDREVDSRVKVSDQDVEQFIQDEKSKANDPAHMKLNLAQILVAVPEGASAAQITGLQAKAERALTRAREGEDFGKLALEYSDAPGRNAGGVMGFLPADRYPSLFVDATKDLDPGALTPILRSGAGFHILKVVEKESPDRIPSTVTQSRARHILLRITPQLTEAQAVARIKEFRAEIVGGRANFADLAKEHSQDGSAAQGGDLGWVNPGSFVPEFEEVMNSLAPGDISQPVVSRFGVHLIQLMERRETKLTPAERTDVARNMLREKKMEEAYVNWVEEVRGRAYVEFRDPPE